MSSPLDVLLHRIRACRVCEAHLPLGPRPVVAAHPDARILVVGQAPGLRVHQTGIPWDDLSGERLRDWMGVDRSTFYDEHQIAIAPIGFCYPGRKGGGDAPPRPECAPLWHAPLLQLLPNIELTILIGQYAIARYLGKQRKQNLTETVRTCRDYLPDYLPLVHPSPRNQPWLQRHPWFAEQVLPLLKDRVQHALSATASTP